MTQTHPARRDDALPLWRAEEILKSRGAAQIVLGEKTYILSLTRAGKLILTKDPATPERTPE
ncbi:hemin uptake protein HemP [Palleronia sediminis]|uniref:Hemin uptake protein HemP n=1 Tax=Palleronia sediminis TaxID=2547833 RepID=A0A4R6A6X3_9RHOB|nr:hemin uptake protein HemP [Palleronia sediminis]TDL79481.1 hemin uptake protein HemP [Palleronia sediminis]